MEVTAARAPLSNIADRTHAWRGNGQQRAMDFRARIEAVRAPIHPVSSRKGQCALTAYQERVKRDEAPPADAAGALFVCALVSVAVVMTVAVLVLVGRLLDDRRLGG
jgi:hypothetical protein